MEWGKCCCVQGRKLEGKKADIPGNGRGECLHLCPEYSKLVSNFKEANKKLVIVEGSEKIWKILKFINAWKDGRSDTTRNGKVEGVRLPGIERREE